MKNILITGVSTGIGNSLAHVFVKNGYRVFGSVRRDEEASQLKELLGEQFYPLIFDVTDENAVEQAAEKVLQLLGENTLTGLINNAGIAVGGPVMHMPLGKFRHQFDVNLFGMFSVTKAFVPLLKAREPSEQVVSKIINISSVSGKLGFPFMAPYCASKFAIEGFSESLRRELLIYGIDVVVVAPGPIDTPIWDKAPDPKGLKDNDFSKPISVLYNYMKNAKNSGKIMSSEVLAKKIFRIMEKKQPKTRYTFLKNKFIEYIVPKYLLPPRLLDNIIKKRFMK